MVNVIWTQETRLLIEDVREMCIKNEFYTNGDCEEYSEMLKMCSAYRGNVDDLIHIAWDIFDHSDNEELRGFEYVLSAVEWIASCLLMDCSYTTIEYEEKED